VTTISVIISSTREGRFGDQPANWFHGLLAKRPDVTAKLLDLRNFPMPFFDQVMPPAWPGRPPYAIEVVQRWTAEIAGSDGFVIVAAEYNYGPPAVLKNALDWVYPEWNRKPIGFVSYGSAVGARGVQQLRETAVELQMAPVRSAVHLPRETLMAYFTGGDVSAALANSDGDAEKLIDDLLWWTGALKAARAGANRVDS
jgi:NAD(P)H-dependent FMN reductase